MSRARDLSRLTSPTNFTVDALNSRVGLGSTVPAAKLAVSGIVSATSFFGDGSNLEGVSSAGLGTAVDDTSEFGGKQIYFTDKVLGISGNVTVNPPDSSNIAYTQYQEISVDTGADLIISDGDDLIPDILGISSDVQTPGILAGGGGRVRADNFSNKAGTGAPTFPTGINVSGAATVSGNLTVGGVLTYADVTNIDAIGIITARSDVSIADKIIHTGDTNTAIRFPAADTFTVETGGSEVARFDSGQRLLVGLTAARSIADGTPKLQVEGTAGTASLGLVRNQNNSGGSNLSFAKSRSASLGGSTIVQDDDTLGSINFAGADGADINSVAASIIAAVDGTPGSNDMPGRLVFSTTADGAASATERLRITSAGVVVVGHTAATTSGASNNSNFNIVGNIGSATGEGQLNLWKRTAPSADNVLGLINFCGDTTGDPGAIIKGEADAAWDQGGDTSDHPSRLTFFTVPDNSSVAAERLRITSAGNVSIQNDSGKFTAGAGDDLQIYHDGSNSVIKDNGTGKLILDTDGSAIEFQKAGLETIATFNTDGAVELYHNNSKKFETTSSGASITGSLDLPNVNSYITGNGHNVLQVDATRTYFYGGTNGVQLRKADNSSEIVTVDNVGNAVFDGTVSDSKGNLRKLIANTQSGTYTLVAADSGKYIWASNTVTVPNNVFSAGDMVTIVNDTSSNLTITNDLAVMYLSADGTNAASRTLGAHGMATLLFVSATVAYISGAGLS